MAQEAEESTLHVTPEDNRITSSAPSSSGERSTTEPLTEPSLSRSVSSSRLNAGAPEFVPRAPTTVTAGGHQRIVKMHHHPSPPPPMIHVFHTPPSPPMASPQFISPGSSIGAYDYFGGAIGGPAGGFGEHDFVQSPADSDPALSAWDGLSDDIVQKVTKQVGEYLIFFARQGYFSAICAFKCSIRYNIFSI